MSKEMIFHQLFEPETSTFTYLLGDKISREALIIDPVLEMVSRDWKLVQELGLNLKFSLETHLHADHVTGAGELRALSGCKTGASVAAHVSCVDLQLNDGDQLKFGPYVLRVLATPGHTDSCLSFVVEDFVFTGDCLMIRGTGRTDFQGGSSEVLYSSITEKLFRLPPETKVYPGHDYKGFTATTIADEIRLNPRLGQGKSKQDFVKIMSELKLPQPKKIAEALPANRSCGAKVQM